MSKIPDTLCGHCGKPTDNDMVCMLLHDDCEELCDDCYVKMCEEIGI
jgi:hypothetical protein